MFTTHDWEWFESHLLELMVKLGMVHDIVLYTKILGELFDRFRCKYRGLLS